ncbi:hypothetical protein H0H92_004043 [Tricholoma furcatifolium]|nr:hypothetical protein H0H92_004043 [Tricholoma furcatifolium]
MEIALSELITWQLDGLSIDIAEFTVYTLLYVCILNFTLTSLYLGTIVAMLLLEIQLITSEHLELDNQSSNSRFYPQSIPYGSLIALQGWSIILWISLSDFVLIWRASILWADSRLKIFLRALLVPLWARLAFNRIVYPTSTIVYGVVSHINDMDILLPVSLSVNLMSTTAIAIRFWVHLKFTKALRRRKRSSVEKVFVILVDSGILFCAMQIAIVLLAFTGELKSTAGRIFSSVYWITSAIYPLLFFLIVNDDDHPIIESVGFTAADNLTIEAGVPDGQHLVTSDRLVFATQSAMAVDPPHPAQAFLESPQEQYNENNAPTTVGCTRTWNGGEMALEDIILRPGGATIGLANEDSATSEDLKLNDLVYASIPSIETSDPNGQTHCLLRRTALNSILASPGFPQYPTYPLDVCYRIGPSKHGLGMFATRDLVMGDHILTERPLTVTPTNIPMPYFASALKAQGIHGVALEHAKLNKWECAYLRPCFERLDLDQQAAFLRLANAHEYDESGPILGIIRTNGLELAVTGDSAERHIDESDEEYAAVCRDMSRINHSPSADRFFDIHSFSFQLRATRAISAGEEITISYCYVLESYASRQAYLASYGITCTCTSCRPPTLLSDARRLALLGSIDAIDSDFEEWLADSSLADDYTIKISLRWIRVIEEEALEASDAYRHHLHAIVRAYVTLGDLDGAMRYGTLLGLWVLGQSGKDDILKKMSSADYHKGRPGWATRVRVDYDGK